MSEQIVEPPVPTQATIEPLKREGGLLQPLIALGCAGSSGILVYVSRRFAASSGGEVLLAACNALIFWLALSGGMLLLAWAVGKFRRHSLGFRAAASMSYVALAGAVPLVGLIYHFHEARGWLRKAETAQAQSARAGELLQSEEALNHWATMSATRLVPDWDQRYNLEKARAGETVKALLASFGERGLDPAFRSAAMRVDWALGSRIRRDEAPFADARAGRFDKAEAAFASKEAAAAREAFQGQAKLLLESLHQTAAEAQRKVKTEIGAATGVSVLFAIFTLSLAGLLARQYARVMRTSVAEATEPIAQAFAARGLTQPESPEQDEVARLGVWAQSIVASFTEREQALEKMNGELRAGFASAEDLSRLKGSFLEKMNRDLRAPVNGVVGMASLLADSGLRPDQRENLTDLQSSAVQLINILDQIADFSRIESRNLSLEKIDFDLRLLVNGVAEGLRSFADRKNLDLVVFVEEDVPSLLRGDPGRLRQVIYSLLENAVKFTDSGEVSARVSLLDEGNEAVTVKFCVDDTGPGIAKERQETIFDEFGEAALSHTKLTGVSGLGLALCRQIVQLMEGKILVKSSPGKGSTFEFSVGFEKQPKRETTRAAPARDGRIFVIAANPGRRQKFSELLPRLGMKSTIFSGCGEALDALRRAARTPEGPYSYGFFDELGSEDETGMLFQEARRDPVLRGSPLIFIAAAGRRGDAELARGLGCAGYLSGEITAGLLASVSARILHRQAEEDSGDTDFITRHSVAEYRRRTGRVLLAEDDLINQKLVLTVLRKAGLRADAVDNGRAAVAAVETRRYDVVLMDCTMPEMDGFEATAMIRRRGKSRHIPIIAFTAHTAKGDRERCVQAGMDDYVAKPIVPQTLLAVVDKWILETSSEEEEPFYPIQELPLDGLRSEVRPDETDNIPEGEEGRKLIQSFLDDAPRQISAARRAMHAKRASALERATAQLKDACSVLGILSLTKLLEQIELCASNDNLEAAQGLFFEAETELKKTQQTLETKLQNAN